MVVGDDIAVSRNDESRTQRLCFPGLFAATALAIAEQAVERSAGKGVGGVHADALGGGDIDHGGLQLFGQIGKAHRGACARGEIAYHRAVIGGGLCSCRTNAGQGCCTAGQKQSC